MATYIPEEGKVRHVPHAEGKQYRVFGDLMTFKLGSEQTEGHCCLIIDKVPPAANIPLHRHMGQEVFFILDGTLLIKTPESSFQVEVGDLVHIPEGAVHGYLNTSDHPATMLVLFLPSGQVEQFFQLVGEPMTSASSSSSLPPAQPDPNALLEIMQKYHIELFPPSDVARDTP
jgi:quercetin dioxygenase-like cupin family protein